jgi:hypothetical protein
MNPARPQSGERDAESGSGSSPLCGPSFRKLPHKLRPTAAQPTSGQASRDQVRMVFLLGRRRKDQMTSGFGRKLLTCSRQVNIFLAAPCRFQLGLSRSGWLGGGIFIPFSGYRSVVGMDLLCVRNKTDYRGDATSLWCGGLVSTVLVAGGAAVVLPICSPEALYLAALM